MLEVIFVVFLCRSLGNRLRAKGRKPFWMQVMLVVFWIGGEFTGGFVAGVWHAVRNGPEAPMGIGIYAIAMVGAALGAGVTFLVASLLPPVETSVYQGSVGINSVNRHVDPDNPYAS